MKYQLFCSTVVGDGEAGIQVTWSRGNSLYSCFLHLFFMKSFIISFILFIFHSIYDVLLFHSEPMRERSAPSIRQTSFYVHARGLLG